MRFKNLTDSTMVRPDAIHCFLSQAELKKYNVEYLKEMNLIEVADADFKIKEGTYEVKLNDKSYKMKIENIDVGHLYGIRVTIDDNVEFEIRKIKEIDKYTCLRGIIANLNNLEK